MGRLQRFTSDRRGLSAIEFAFIAPLMVTAYLGLAELCNAMLAQNRAQHAASTVGDLVAQDSTITNAELSDIFSVASTIMSPLPTNSLKMEVTSIVADSKDATTVGWSQGYGGMGAQTQGATIAAPSGIVAANGSVIKAEVQYTYSPSIPFINKAGYTFDQVFYLAPRQTTIIPPPT
jgi:Flp pilus assembly protein TadG